MKLSPFADVRTLDLASPGSLVYLTGGWWGIRAARTDVLRLEDRVLVACEPDSFVVDYGTEWTASYDPHSAFEVSPRARSNDIEGGELCFIPGPPERTPSIIMRQISGSGTFEIFNIGAGTRHMVSLNAPDGFAFRRWSIVLPMIGGGTVQLYPAPAQSE